MKKIIAALVMFSLVGVGTVSFAATTASVGVEATVPQELELTSWMRYSPPGIGPYGAGSGDATSLNFGTLTKDPTYGIWVSDRYFTAFLLGASSGRDYKISQTCTGFSFGGEDLDDSLMMKPDYVTDDEILPGVPQGSKPVGDIVASQDLAVGSNLTIYTSNAGLSRIVRAYYGLSTGAAGEPSGAVPITSDQLSGTYSGTVTFSIVLD